MAAPETFSTLSELAQGSESNLRRYEKLVQRFQSIYGKQPQFVVRAPGRVNLIGEHIDYCGYGVLPMAIEQDVAIACSATDSGKIELANTNSSQYDSYTCPSSGYHIDHSTVKWFNYFLCGHKGVSLQEQEQGDGVLRGMQILVDGNVPPRSGLSSSSAVVCCSAVSAIVANQLVLPSKATLADRCAKYERFIGTIGGGMDQAISFLAEKGSAFMIEFNPIRPSQVRLPPGYNFIIANSLVDVSKAASDSRYNDRVVECRIAAKIIAKARGVDWRSVNILSNVQSALNCELHESIAEPLHKEPYSKEEVCNILGIPEDKLVEEVLPKEATDKAKQVAMRMTKFKLYQRAAHVFGEAHRVIQFRDVANDKSCDPASTAKQLGDLMNSSHDSCRDLYECSCPELDSLVKVCQSSGALGARLTGAGWGGCVVCLVPTGSVESFVKKVQESYYSNLPESEIHLNLFATQPGPGAAVCAFK